MGIERTTRRLFNEFYHARFMGSAGAFKLYKEYSSHSRLSPDELEQIQLRLLKKLLIHAGKNTLYFKRLFGDLSFDPEKLEAVEQLDIIPPLTKELVQENFDSLIASNISAKDMHRSVTGGTSGIKMHFYRNNSCRAHRVAAQWRADSWTGWKPNENVAYIWPAIQDIRHLRSFRQHLLNKYVTGFEPYPAMVLDDNICREIVSDMQKFKPKIIRCFPHSAVVIAEYMEANNIRLPSVKAIIPTGEPLYSHQRQMFERVFEAEVYNLYASREHGTMAAECYRHENLHIASDSVLIEVTADGRRLSNGEQGEILITDLHNYAFPLIRFTIHDYGQLLDGTCECGMPYPLLKNVVGRTGDLLYGTEGQKVSPIVLLMHIVGHGPLIGQMQVIQNSYKEILVRLSNDPYPDEDTRTYIANVLKEQVSGVEKIDFEILDKIEAEKSGKFRFTINKIKEEDNQ